MGRWTKNKDNSACFVMELPLPNNLKALAHKLEDQKAKHA